MSDFLLHSCLLIDDNPIDRFVHKRLLRHHKIADEIIEIENGREALEFLKVCLEDHNQIPDMILLDLMMPEMDGFEFMSHYEIWVQKVPKAPKLFMVSSTEDDRDIRRSRESRYILRLLRKPLVPSTLIKIIP